MTAEQRLAKLNEEIRKAENAKIQAETRLESLESQYRGINDEFVALGIDPKDALTEKEELEKEMVAMEEEINRLLSGQNIQEYKAF